MHFFWRRRHLKFKISTHLSRPSQMELPIYIYLTDKGGKIEGKGKTSLEKEARLRERLRPHW